MKTYILFMLSLVSLGSTAQVKEKDTLFFKTDKYYTISPALFPDLANKTYLERIDFIKIQMKETQTNGYILFENDFSIKGLNPKKVLSLKKFIENKEFYLNGQYNKIVDKWKLKKYLTDKYILFFVNGDEFIKPKGLEYISYYPIRNENGEIITNTVKDTLYFDLNTKYILKSRTEADCYVLKKSDNSSSGNGVFFFKELKSILFKNVKPKKILNLENFIYAFRFHIYNRQQKLDDYKLAEFLSNYVVFIVEKNKYIEVQSGTKIE